MVENQFGGSWTEAKLICLASYLRSYSTIMKHQTIFRRIYIDPFSGPGNRVEADFNVEDLFEVSKEEKPVSPVLATEIGENFDEFFFNDKRSEFIRSLQDVIQTGKPVHYSSIEANEFLANVISAIDWKKSRAVIFLDPFGLHVDWKTLDILAKTRAVDIVMLFPTSSLCRMLPNRDLPSDKWEGKLDRFLGTGDWRKFYRIRQETDMFVTVDKNFREASSEDILHFVRQRLETLFFVANNVFELKNSKGSPLFHIFFMCANRSPKVRNMVNEIASGAVKFARKEIENGRRK